MNIFIVGGGSVGALTAEYFCKEGHDITIIEHDARRVKALQDQFDVRVVEGKGTDAALLNDSGLKEAQLFLALTDHDETNIIACTLAKFAGVPRRIARISDAQFMGQDRILSLRDLGVDEVVNTSDSLTQEILQFVEFPGMADIKYFLDRKIAVVKFGFGKNSSHYGKALGDIRLPGTTQTLGCAQVGGFRPFDPAATVNEFLYGYFACEAAQLGELHRNLAAGTQAINRVMIYGGGYKTRFMGGDLGLALKARGVSTVELIEEQEEEAKVLSARYPFKVLLDAPSTPHFARTGNLEGLDLFIGISPNFEKSLYACAVAHRQGAPFTLALVRYPEHTAFVSAIPLTTFLNPAIVTANKILKYHQADTIISRSILEYTQSECMEVLVTQSGRLAGMTLGDIKFGASRCLGILRDQQLLEPTNTLMLQVRDRALFMIDNSDAEHFRSLF